MKLNLGSGYTQIDGFLNIDKNPNTNPDYVLDIENNLFPFEDNTITEIRAYHIFEHIGLNFFQLMKEIYRICEDQAVIDIQVPHHRSEIWFGDPSHIRFITIDNMRMFSKKYNRINRERFNSCTDIAEQLNVDFEIIDFKFKPSYEWLERFKTLSNEQILEISKNFNNVYDETHIKMMVIK
jgi:hypothetical protein